MPDSPLQYFRTTGLGHVAGVLRDLRGRSADYLLDDSLYRQSVTEPAWSHMDDAFRRVGRKALNWDKFCLAVRDDVLDLDEGRVTVRTDSTERLEMLAKKWLYPALQGSGRPTVDATAGVSADSSETTMEFVRPKRGSGRKPVPQQATDPDEIDVEPVDAPVAIALGIDLGTTFSVVAHLDSHGRPTSVPNAAGDVLTPSVVLFDDDGPVVGKEAVQAAALEPERVADVVKRDMGAKAYHKKINGQDMPPEVISSFVLRSLKADAERKLGTVKQAVITVPAYFDEPRRRATVDAGKLAGLDVLDIINEPTAAAIAYGHQLGYLDRSGKAVVDRPLRVLVYDLGGGTFDVTIMEIQGRSFRALATDGDVYLGGKDWDEKLVELAAGRFRDEHGDDPRGDPHSLQELWAAAESAKRTLSERSKATMVVNHLGKRMKVEVTREQFEEATAELLGRTRTTAEIVVRQAGLVWPAIDRVLLTGGSTRMPAVGRMLAELAGKPPERSVSPDEAVAHGAALYADLLLHHKGVKAGPAPFSVTNVNSHSLGIVVRDPATGQKRNHILLPKNRPLPCSVTKAFRTSQPDQRKVVVRVMEGESHRPEACSAVGVCTVRGLPPNLPVGWPVQVSYAYEANGRLRVSARVEGQDRETTTEFQRDNSLAEGDLKQWAKYVANQSARRS
jgi:molecular chaperone DnaK